MRTQYYTASSIDGFIADPDNSLSWLLSRDIDPSGPMNYSAFISEVGAMVMGATTYEWIIDHEFTGKDRSEWVWPYDLPCWVFTHRDLPQVPNAAVTFTSDDAGDVHARALSAASGRNVWVVGGGDLAGQFADRGLLDDLIVQYAPVILGAGAPLLPRRIEMKLEEFGRNRDFAVAHYSVVR